MNETHLADGAENQSKGDRPRVEAEPFKNISEDSETQHDENIGNIVADGIRTDDGQKDDERGQEGDGQADDRPVQNPPADDPHRKHENRGDKQGENKCKDDLGMHGE